MCLKLHFFLLCLPFSVGTTLSDIQKNHFLITFVIPSCRCGIADVGLIDFKVKKKIKAPPPL